MSGVCVAIRLSPELAAQFPAQDGEPGKVDAPHITVAYFKPPADADLPAVEGAVRDALAATVALVQPFPLALTGGTFTFPPSESSDGLVPYLAAVQSEGLLAFRRQLMDALAAHPWAVAADMAFGGYVPHATIAYLPAGELPPDGPRPHGQMVVDSVEMWVGDDVSAVPIAGEATHVIAFGKAATHTPPTTVASAARRGLRLAARAGVTDKAAIKCGSRLAERKPHSLADVSKLFARHSLSATHKPANVGSDATPSKWLAESLLMGGQAGHDWAASVVRRAGAGESAAALGLARRGEAQMWSREAPPMPATALVHNPNGLHMGRAFRVLTAGQTVRDGNDGATLGNFDAPTLAEFVRVFEARCRAGEGAPRIDYNHGPSRGMDPTLFGAVVACYVADDGERGPGLYVVPGWTDYGRDFIAKHATPDGGSVLSNSPEFRVGPAYARGGGSPDEQGALLGGAELLGVAITGSPQQSEAIIDPIRLSRSGAGTAYAAEEVSGMDPEQEAASGGDEMAEVKATLAQVVEQQAKFGQLLAAISAKLDGDGAAIVAEASEAAMSAVEDVTAEAVEEVRAAAEQQMSELTPDEVAEVDESVGEEIKSALSRRTATNGEKRRAWARKGEIARRVFNQRQVKALSREVETLKARALDAECDAEMVRLRGIGMAPADEAFARAQWHAKQREGQAWSKANAGIPHAFDRFVGDLKRAPRVPMGVRGVAGDDVVNPVSIAGVKAWAKENGKDFDKDPASTFSAWERATGHNYKEIRQ